MRLHVVVRVVGSGSAGAAEVEVHILDQRRICRWRMMNVMLCMARRNLGTVANLSVVEGSERPMLYQGTCGEGVSGVRLSAGPSAGGEMTERRGRGRYRA